MKPLRVLFICKKNEVYSFVTMTRRSCGLYNSTNFIVKALDKHGIHAEIIEVQDNNDIDREVSRFKPDIVIIEALWVVPEKFPVLFKLHPKVKWFCHLHSHMPFLALEGIAMDWIKRYAALGVGLIANSRPSYEALRCILSEGELVYLPNVYVNKMHPTKPDVNPDEIHIGCFGAIRPLKNHLLQAMAAIKYAQKLDRRLVFYVNASRVETGGQPVLKNLKQLFEKLPQYKLVEMHWNEPEEFIRTLSTKIDIGMQVSLTETFSVVAADYTAAGVPMVISKEVYWGSKWSRAKDDSVRSIVKLLERVHGNCLLVRLNQFLLRRHAKLASAMWVKFIRATGR